MYKGKNPILDQKRKCSISRVKNCANSFVERANKIHNNKYDYSKAEYKSWHSEVIIICPKHGEFKMVAGIHLNGCGCPKCGKENMANKQRNTNWKEKANKIHNNKYDYSKFNYINGKTKSIIICPIHGEFEMDMLHHYRGQGCKECSKMSKMSKGEKFISEFLNNNNVKYIHNYILKEDKYLFNKPYDFFIESKNLLIEFQGEQHYKKKWNMTDKDLEERQLIDKNKKELALKYGYNFITISDKDNIEKILSSTTIETK
jgi:very-short-patch-repair endonuclease